MDGMDQQTEFKVKPNPKLEKRSFTMQTIFASDLAKLCLMRCFHPERMILELRNLTTKFLGEKFAEPLSLDWARVISLSSKRIPTILMTGPNANPYLELKFAKQSSPGLTDTEVVY